MWVSHLVQDLGVSADTVRYYTKQGFLAPKINKSNGYKEYSEKDRRRLRFILSARQLGFSVKDIEAILEKADKGGTPCPLVRRLIDQRLHETEKTYREAILLRQKMQAAIKEWSAKPDRAPTGKMICQLIEDYEQSESK